MTPSTPQVEYPYDETEAPSEALIAAVAAKTHRDPLEFDPLYETIDPDALNAIFQPRGGNNTNSPTASVELRFEGQKVIITAGCIRVLDPDVPNADISTSCPRTTEVTHDRIP